MKALCVFNNKGGVGKTTLLCNLASFLAIKKKKKVLVVDADPQCNATAYMIEEKILENLYSSANDAGTINDLIASLRKSKGYAEVPTIKSSSFSVDVVPGDPRFSLAEDFLAKDWFEATNGQERGLKTTYFFRALLRWAQTKKYDYVFFDVGPSLGAINRTVLLSCHYFLLPMSSDIFSLRGLQNIETAVTTWKKGITRGLDAFREENGFQFELDGDGPVEPTKLRFLGYVTQQYTAKTVNGKKQPVKSYEKIIRRIEPSIRKHLVTNLNEGISAQYQLGEIPYFQSLVPMSQISSKPIFSLKSADGIVGAHFDKVKQFEAVIKSIAQKFESNVNSLS